MWSIKVAYFRNVGYTFSPISDCNTQGKITKFGVLKKMALLCGRNYRVRIARGVGVEKPPLISFLCGCFSLSHTVEDGKCSAITDCYPLLHVDNWHTLQINLVAACRMTAVFSKLSSGTVMQWNFQQTCSLEVFFSDDCFNIKVQC